MKTILSDHGNNVDVTKLNDKQLNKLLKETRKTLTGYGKMLALPLTFDEENCYHEMRNDCIKDIEIIEKYLETKSLNNKAEEQSLNHPKG